MKFHYLYLLILLLLVAGCGSPVEVMDLQVTGVESPAISLNGTWKFAMEPPDGFWRNNIEFHDWPDIRVPGECQMQGFAIKHDQPYVYKTKFLVPGDYEGKHIQLDFYGVYSFARVWVNGQFIRDHYGGFTKWSCDITGQVEPGNEAILTIEFMDPIDDISYGSGYAKHQIGGILRDVELTALPKQHFRELFFETDLDEEYRDALLNISYNLNQNSPAEIKVEIMDAL